MKALLLAASLGVLACIPAAAGAQINAAHPFPPMPREREGLPCGAYCGHTWRACRSVPLFDAPRSGAALLGWLPPHELVAPVEGRNVTESPGVVVFRDTTRPPPYGEALDPPPDSLFFVPGDTLYILNRQSDGDIGFYNTYFRGQHLRLEYKLWQESFDAQPDATAIMVRSLESTWWVRIRRSGGTSAWTRETGAFAGVNPKYGGGPDRCLPIR